MGTARFCSECGERLKVNRFSYLLFRSFCAHCSPRFNRARLMLIVALTLSAAIGFAIGHFSSAREPFYYIGTPVESSSSLSSPSSDGAPAHSSRKSELVAPREQLVISPSSSEAICGARTRSGKPCQRKVKGGGYCWQHRDRVDEKKSSTAKQK